MSIEPTSAEAASPGPAGGFPAAPPLRIQCQDIDRLLQAGRAYRIGRDPQADIPLADPRVSWQHAIVEEQAGTWLLQDAGSTNGTFVSRQRVRQVAIAGNCSVRLGHADDGPMLDCSLAGAPAAPVRLQATTAVLPAEALQADEIWAAPARQSSWDRGPSAFMKRLAKTRPGKRR